MAQCSQSLDEKFESIVMGLVQEFKRTPYVHKVMPFSYKVLSPSIYWFDDSLSI